MKRLFSRLALGVAAGAGLVSGMAPMPVFASSHREAPFVTEMPKVDGTDLYFFRSYEPDRQGFITILANYVPLQHAYGGPNYYSMDPNAAYDINIDNDGDSKPDLTFRFQFTNLLRDQTVPTGMTTTGLPINTSIPLIQSGAITAEDQSKINVIETYRVTLGREGNFAGRGRNVGPVVNAFNGSVVHLKPLDNIGRKTFPNYAAYANAHIYPVIIPGCPTAGKVFVGQRKEGFFINLGEIFDLVNYNPLGAANSRVNVVKDLNITTLGLELPIACVVANSGIIGAWTTASLPTTRTLQNRPTFGVPERHSGRFVQVSRLGMPLVNELVIGVKDKNKFNQSLPKDDGQFGTYVAYPSLPVLLKSLFPSLTVPPTPRNDLIQAFVTGLPGLNQFGFGEMQRLNLNIAPKARGSQNNLGALGLDNAGFPNGRRPGDDVVDITLRVAMGALLPEGVAPSGQLPLTDGAPVADVNFSAAFPYLTTPTPGSPAS